MIGPIALAIRCGRAVRRATMHANSATMHGKRLTMAQAAALLAPRPRLVRRAVALGCPAAALPTTAMPPILPALPMPLPPEQVLPLPFGIGTGPLLPDVLPLAGAPLPWTDIATTAAAVAEPSALGALLVGLFLLAVVRVS